MPDLCLEYCREKNITPKLHCLNYDQWTPTWVEHNNVAEVKRLLEKRFAEIAARYAGQIHCMEVINETLLWYDEWKDQGRWSTQFFFEDDLVEWSFQCARKYFPSMNSSSTKPPSRRGTSTRRGAAPILP